MKIINALEKRSKAPKDKNVKIELKLYSLADDIEKQARNHLKRVGSILHKEGQRSEEANGARL